MGLAKRMGIIYFNNNIEVHFITYEQGYERFESKKVPRIVLDEEPPNEKIWNAALTHCHHLTLVETPYRGVTFTYHSIRNAKDNDGAIKFYHCTQYDSPYQERRSIATDRITMPKWEVEARVYGLHSEQVGKPYFHDMYERIQLWVKGFVNMGVNYTLEPPMYTSPKQLAEMQVRAVQDPEGMWEVYEEPRPNYAYFMSCDTARGDDGGDERVDANVAHVFRLPGPEEDTEFPIEVACCRTVKDTKYFARECLCACSWYNNALLAPEANGFSAGTFINEVHGYPFMYTMTVTDDRTKKPVERIGFNTNVKTRQMLFDEVCDFIKTRHDEKRSPFKSFSTVHEISRLIVGKGGRPDHPKDGTSDSVISYGIGLYLYAFDRHQIKCNSGFRDKKENKFIDRWGGRFIQHERENRPVLGSKRGLDRRGFAK